ncbi:putative oxidoreductase [Hypoxylon sp. FL1284]|nr:putative oxidoreductase [Hypoxylon sp. FL1284]
MAQPTEFESTMAPPGDTIRICCHALSAALGAQKVAYPGSDPYNASIKSYHAEQQEVMRPSCIVLPQTAEDVSTATGTSNIQDGPIIDIHSLNTVELNVDSQTVSAGAGASWGDIYKVLDPHGLSVNGSRAYGIGVSGFTLGGGISYTSPRHGWACDTVSKFQLVLADGSIVETDSTSRPDLLWALKGGNNNFGIVTSITLTTFQQDLVWSGSLVHLPSSVDDVINEFVKFNSADSYDEYASAITSFAYSQARGMAVIHNLLVYTKDVPSTPATFEGFMTVPNVYNMTSVANMTGKIINLVTTLVSNALVIKAAYDKWNSLYPAVKDVANIVFCLVLEPLPPIFYQRHATTNALGLADRTGPLVVALISVSWSNASDDALVHRTSRTLLEDINSAAKELGGLDPYIYMNYASSEQDVIRSYGAESVSKLKQVREEVDPEGMFTYQAPGGYKIPRN